MGKYQNRLPLYIVVGCLLWSCSDQLELRPYQSIDNELALSSDANIKKVLLGAYDEVSSSNLYGGNVFLLAEMLSANREIRWQGTFNQPDEVYAKSILANNSYVTGTWTQAYDVINTCNNILSAVDVVDEADRARVQGEALFLRGAMYFELVKLYGLPYAAGNVSSNLGVPIVLQPTTSITAESNVSRASVGDVYQQVLADLTQAESLLPATNGFYATSSGASAMLSRVYLQMEDFANARDAANRAIETAEAAGKQLVGNYASVFNNAENTSEDLFAMQVSAQDGANQMHLFYSVPEFGGRDGDVAVLPAHLALYEAGDQRLVLFYTYAGDSRVGKWREQYRNVKVIRLAEMYLTRAEANFREGTNVGDSPFNDLRRIRGRVGLETVAEDVTLAFILNERKLELAHEGHTIHDVKRTGGSILDNSAGSSTTFTFDSPRMVFPIPLREMDANENLIQNPGYGN